VPKLLVCVDIYRGLGLGFDDGFGELDGVDYGGDDMRVMRKEVNKKLASMLLHPFPRVRMAAAEALWVVGEVGGVGAGTGTGYDGEGEGGVVPAGNALLEGKWMQPVDAEMKTVVREVKGRLGV